MYLSAFDHRVRASSTACYASDFAVRLRNALRSLPDFLWALYAGGLHVARLGRRRTTMARRHASALEQSRPVRRSQSSTNTLLHNNKRSVLSSTRGKALRRRGVASFCFSGCQCELFYHRGRRPTRNDESDAKRRVRDYALKCCGSCYEMALSSGTHSFKHIYRVLTVRRQKKRQPSSMSSSQSQISLQRPAARSSLTSDRGQYTTWPWISPSKI